MTDLQTNPRFVEFRAALERRGARLNCLWSGKTGRDPSGKGYDDVALYAVQAGSRARVSTVIVQDFGERNGFGLWLEDGNVSIGDSVTAILGE